ncbi:MAG: hypothetical protein ACK5MV_00150 [Aminipila sp.]
MDIAKALAEYASIVRGLKEEYTQEELCIGVIRQQHKELDFFEDDEIEDIIDFANQLRRN